VTGNRGTRTKEKGEGEDLREEKWTNRVMGSGRGMSERKGGTTGGMFEEAGRGGMEEGKLG